MSSLQGVVIADFSRVSAAASERLRTTTTNVAEARSSYTTTHAAARALAQEDALATVNLQGRVA